MSPYGRSTGARRRDPVPKQPAHSPSACQWCNQKRIKAPAQKLFTINHLCDSIRPLPLFFLSKKRENTPEMKLLQQREGEKKLSCCCRVLIGLCLSKGTDGGLTTLSPMLCICQGEQSHAPLMPSSRRQFSFHFGEHRRQVKSSLGNVM